jgi:hypothetical protein
MLSTADVIKVLNDARHTIRKLNRNPQRWTKRITIDPTYYQLVLNDLVQALRKLEDTKNAQAGQNGNQLPNAPPETAASHPSLLELDSAVRKVEREVAETVTASQPLLSYHEQYVKFCQVQIYGD